MTIVLERESSDADDVVVAATTPGSISWSGGPDDTEDLARGARQLSRSRRVRADLVAMRSGSDNGVRVPIEFKMRSIFNGHTALIGQDQDGIVKLRIAITSRDTLSFKTTIRAPEGVLPKAILPVLEFNEVLASGGRFGLWLHDAETWAATPVEAGGRVPSTPVPYLAAVRALVRIQASTGVEFAMPRTIDEQDADAINLALKLLTGRAVEVGWTAATVVHDEWELEDLGLNVVGVQHREAETVTPVDVTIGDVSLCLGEFLARFRSVTVADVAPSTDDSGEVTVALRPGDDNRVILRLLSRRHFDPFDRHDLETVPLNGHRSGPGLRSMLDR